MLVDTISNLLPQVTAGRELLVIDQTVTHDAATDAALQQWSDDFSLKWIRLEKPSVTASMNVGLCKAQGEIVLFLDDDIEPAINLLDAHIDAHESSFAALVAGRVAQPWERQDKTLSESLFNSSESGPRSEFMGGNFSVKRRVAIEAGGFDENFLYAAYRYEREFADRLLKRGEKIYYCANASLDHLQARDGGVRSYGDHLTTIQPGHSLGAFYYMFRSESESISAVVQQVFGAVATKFHLKHPWYIPVTIAAQLRGLYMALKLCRNGPVLLDAKLISGGD